MDVMKRNESRNVRDTYIFPLSVCCGPCDGVLDLLVQAEECWLRALELAATVGFIWEVVTQQVRVAGLGLGRSDKGSRQGIRTFGSDFVCASNTEVSLSGGTMGRLVAWVGRGSSMENRTSEGGLEKQAAARSAQDKTRTLWTKGPKMLTKRRKGGQSQITNKRGGEKPPTPNSRSSRSRREKDSATTGGQQVEQGQEI